MNKKVLILSHNAFFGAPNVLLDECRHFKKGGCEFKFIFLEQGPLIDEFRKIGPLMNGKCFSSSGNLAKKIKFHFEKQNISRIINAWKPDFIYANTIAAAPALPFLARFNRPILMHVHELEQAFRMYLDKKRLTEFTNIPTHYIAASKAVENYLIQKSGISREKVFVIYEGVDTERIGRMVKERKENLKQDYDFIVGGAGNGYWRKGVDLWLHTAAKIKKIMSPKRIKFIWVGSKKMESAETRFLIDFEIQKLGLNEDVFFTERQINPYPFYNEFDLFLLTSREDPCPLVVLENMYLEKPVICFEDCGGAPELLSGEAGITVPALSAEKMAREAERLLLDPESAKKLGESAKRKVLSDYEIKKMCGEIKRVWAL